METNLQRAGKTSDSYRKRFDNIQWIKRLNRNGLEYGVKERQVQIAATKRDERLIIQYPGKESRPSKRRPSRKWDFRPKVLRDDGTSGPDLSFADIWDILFKNLEQPSSNLNPEGKEEQELSRALAALFYRMAFMVDHVKQDQPNLRVRVTSHDPSHISDFVEEEFPGPLWLYHPPIPVVDAISELVPEWGGLSLEAFLHYNNLLAWNEDCKYYYRDVEENRKKNWIDDTGRVNTILTHVHIVGFIQREVKPSALLGGFSQGRGVSPAQADEIMRTCKPLVTQGAKPLRMV